MADCRNKITIYLKNPINIKGEEKHSIQVPCKKCARCLERRKLEWGFRMGIEMAQSKTAYFVTLTYDTNHVPINKYGIKTLNNKEHINEETGEITGGDLTRFFKRLRVNQERSEITWEHFYNRLLPSDKIKYYAAGEYGSLRKRPHYHAIIFNASQSIIEKSWSYGGTHVVPANEATISYVMKYLDKTIGSKHDKRKEKEFNTMSEGIGIAYIQKNQLWHKNNLDVLFVTTMQGFKIPMPEYYRKKIFTEDERKLQVILVEEIMKEAENEGIANKGADKYWKDYWDQARISEKIHIKKMKNRNID